MTQPSQTSTSEASRRSPIHLVIFDRADSAFPFSRLSCANGRLTEVPLSLYGLISRGVDDVTAPLTASKCEGDGVDAALLGGIAMDLPGKCGEHQLRNQEVFYGKREQTDAGVSA